MKHMRKYLALCLGITVCLMTAVNIAYAAETANVIKFASEDAVAGSLSAQSIGQGTSFIVTTYAGAPVSSAYCDIMPYPAFSTSVDVNLYGRFFNKVSGTATVFFIVTDDGGHIVDLLGGTGFVNSSSQKSFCASRSYAPGTYFVNILVDAPDGLLLSTNGFLFKVN